MDWLILAAAAVAVVFALLKKNGIEAIPMTMEQHVEQAIKLGIVLPEGMPEVAITILKVQSKLETGSWKAKSFLSSNSLFNRHIGSGRGEWIGSGKTSYREGVDFYNAGSKDPDIRKFVDVYQSARDMRQLMNDGLYRAAKAALMRGSPTDYFNAVAAAGFAEDRAYAANLKRLYSAVA